MVKTREGDAQLAKLRVVIPKFFSEHGPELVHAYLTLHSEHIPLVQALAPIIIRTQGMLAQAQAQAAQEKAE